MIKKLVLIGGGLVVFISACILYVLHEKKSMKTFRQQINEAKGGLADTDIALSMFDDKKIDQFRFGNMITQVRKDGNNYTAIKTDIYENDSLQQTLENILPKSLFWKIRAAYRTNQKKPTLLYITREKDDSPTGKAYKIEFRDQNWVLSEISYDRLLTDDSLKHIFNQPDSL